MLEIERKFILNHAPNIEDDVLELVKISHIKQVYLQYEPTEVRLRSIDGMYFFITEKTEGDLIRDEIEREIPYEEYITYKDKGIGSIEKLRFILEDKNSGIIYEIDKYLVPKSKIYTIEVEFKPGRLSKEFIPPKWFGKEVTYDKRYKNKNIARYGFPKD